MIPLYVFPADPGDASQLERIATHLERGGLLAYPTETVYGLGAPATSQGVAALRALKGRRSDKPFLMLLPDAGHKSAAELAWGPQALSLAERHWPGPLTLVISDAAGRFPDGVRSREGGVAVRVSSNPFVEGLMEAWRGPLLSTSANMPGEAPAQTVDEVLQVVEGRAGIDRLWVADGGPLVSSEPSTIVDCTDAVPRLLRRGRIPAKTLKEVVAEFHDGR